MPIPEPPFSRIALSLSGGGYRAAAFHLGTLDLLERVGLLRRVAILSTASGGTFTGCAYALSLKRGEPFAVFFASLLEFLRGTNVVARAFAALAVRRPDSDPRRRSVITGAADIYDRMVDGRRFADVLRGAGHLEEISFNATEFQTGVAFRFQASRNPAARIGNGHFWMKRSVAGEMRLADVVAASSCFPGAFEPIGFPDDFLWPTPTGRLDPQRRSELSRGFPALLPLMDGGIYDNQATDALLLADARSEAKADLFIVSDTQQRKMSLFDLAAPLRARGPRLRTLFRVGQVAIALLALSAVALARDLLTEPFRGVHLLTRVLPIVVTAAGAAALLLGWRALRGRLQREAPSVSKDVWTGLRSLRVSEVVDLAVLRIRSLIATTADVFMKRVRALGYDRLLRNPAYTDKSIANLIYDLDRARSAQRPGLIPSAAQMEVAMRAAAVPTQLWFDRGLDDGLDLAAAGQSSICFNLLEFLYDHPRPGDPAAAALTQTLKGLWQRLGQDPLCLVRERLQAGARPL